jgi:hypothetical protein
VFARRILVNALSVLALLTILIVVPNLESSNFGARAGAIPAIVLTITLSIGIIVLMVINFRQPQPQKVSRRQLTRRRSRH